MLGKDSEFKPKKKVPKGDIKKPAPVKQKQVQIK
jgi:hypothetical protein